MGQIVTSSTVANTLKATLQSIVDDPLDGIEGKALYKKWMKVDSMKDQYIDQLESAGPGLAVEGGEAKMIPVGSITEGNLHRYLARKFFLGMVASDEAIEDGKYKEIFRFAQRLKRALWKTVDYDATGLLIHAFDTDYVHADGQPLASTANTLPVGGTFSNKLATAMSPSRAAAIIAITMMMDFPGYDALLGDVIEPECVLCPNAQWAVWEGILMSPKAPEVGQFNEINVLKPMNLDIYPNPYWKNTTTHWAIKTDAEDGFQWFWRRRPRTRTWYENDHEIVKHSISARWARGVTNKRCAVFSEA